MTFRALPPAAAWQHRDARVGFEVAFFEWRRRLRIIRGFTTAVEHGESWAVDYELELAPSGATLSAYIRTRSVAGVRAIRLASDGAGRWSVNGDRGHAALFDGCLDVDLEASAMTNALPVRRMRLSVGDEAEAPAVYVSAVDLYLNRLEQTYVRVSDADGHQRYDYESPAFHFAAQLRYDRSGLVLDYPGIAVRAA
jgi:uncharacterized protein